MKSTVETTLENLIEATLGQNASLRDKHLLRQSLHGLVRLVKAEQRLEIKTSVGKLSGVNTASKGRTDSHRVQHQLEFGHSSLDATKSSR